jgi:hypothetical protein
MDQSFRKGKGPGSGGPGDMSQESDSMLQHMLGRAPTAPGRKQPTSATGTMNLPTPPTSVVLAATPGESPTQAVFKQLAHALAVLSGAADLMLANKAVGPNPQSLRSWLQPNARQAEVAMHRLRELRLGPTHAMTELSQCLTILVLAADMLSEGQLSEADAQDCYELLRRNANRAVTGLYELYAQINPNATP